MKLRTIIGGILIALLISCSQHADSKSSYNPKLGIGNYKSIEVEKDINEGLASQGDSLYMKQCATCHYLSKAELIGPGWKGITESRDLTWLMNLMTNTDEMLDEDPSLKEQIKHYKTRMPNFELTHQEARAMLEFMRKNDQGKVSHEREMPEPCMELMSK